MSIIAFNRTHYVAATLLLMLMVVMLVHSGDYGHSWDDGYVLDRGHLTRAFLENYFSPEPVKNLFHFRSSNGIEGDLRHPLLYATLYSYVVDIGTSFGFSPWVAGHFINLCMFWMCLVFFYWALNTAFSAPVALSACVFLALYPSAYAFAYTSSKDLPMMAFGLISLSLLTMVKYREQKKALLVGAAVSMAFAVGAKLEALLLLPAAFFAIPLLVNLKKPGSRPIFQYFRNLRFSLFFLLIVAGVVFLTWPVLWSDLDFIVRVIVGFTSKFNGGHPQLYLGKLYHPKVLPWHYASVYFLVVTPVAVLAMAVLALPSIYVKLRKQNIDWVVLLLFVLSLSPSFLVRSTTGPVRYDGIRHMLFTVPLICLLGGLGLEFVALFLSKKFRLKSDVFALSIVSIFILAHGSYLIYLHPYEYTYFNEIARIDSKTLNKKFAADTGNVSVFQATRWVNENARPGSCFEYRFPSYYPLRPDLINKCEGNNGDGLVYQHIRSRDASYCMGSTRRCWGIKRSEVVKSFSRSGYTISEIRLVRNNSNKNRN